MQKEKYMTTLTLGCDLLGQPEKSGKFFIFNKWYKQLYG